MGVPQGVALVLLALLCCDAAVAAQRSRHIGRRRLHDAASCGISSLGYQCMVQACANIQLHWSLGGAAPDATSCTYTTPTSAMDPIAPYLHMALQTDLHGWVGLAFATRLGYMFDADAIIALNRFGGGGMPVTSVTPYYIQASNAVQPGHAYTAAILLEDPAINPQLTNRDMTVTTAGGITACFTRAVTAVGFAGIILNVSKPVAMNFAASAKTELMSHMHDAGHQCSANVQFYAQAEVGGEDMDSLVGDRNWVVAHGVLMMVAWVLLVPAGILVGRHKWLLTDHGTLWFDLHRGIQVVAMGLFIAGFIIPFQTFVKGEHMHEESSLLQAHAALGITLMIAAGLHLIVAIGMRPKPDSPRRHTWKLAHWWTGRALAVVSVSNICIGIALVHDKLGESVAPWVACLVVGVAGYSALHLALREYKRRHGSSADQYNTGTELLSTREYGSLSHERHTA